MMSLTQTTETQITHFFPSKKRPRNPQHEDSHKRYHKENVDPQLMLMDLDLMEPNQDVKLPQISEVALAWLENEKRLVPASWDYWNQHPDLTHEMREILVEWMLEVVNEFKLSEKTLGLAVNYLDRLLSATRAIHRSNFQLVGVVCLFIASKFEDVEPVTLEALIWISDNAYSSVKVKKMELLVLSTLKYDLAAIPLSTFVEQFLEDVKPDEEENCEEFKQLFEQTKEIVNKVYTRWEILRSFPTSMIACATVYVAAKNLCLIEEWPEMMAAAPLSYSLQEKKVRKCVAKIQALMG